jgi:CheY-like chemotaxis protein
MSQVEVLVAEDNPSDAELILESLNRAQLGERIVVVEDGVCALEFLFCRGAYAGRSFDTPPRLVLLDLKLPKVDGLEVLRQVKSHERTRAIPVVMLTSSRIESDVARAYFLGVNSYVQKPVEFLHFRNTVQAVGKYWLEYNENVPAVAFKGHEN